jgi:hypothetical protein
MKIISCCLGLTAWLFLADLHAQPVLNLSMMSSNQLMLS